MPSTSNRSQKRAAEAREKKKARNGSSNSTALNELVAHDRGDEIPVGSGDLQTLGTAWDSVQEAKLAWADGGLELNAARGNVQLLENQHTESLRALHARQEEYKTLLRTISKKLEVPLDSGSWTFTLESKVFRRIA